MEQAVQRDSRDEYPLDRRWVDRNWGRRLVTTPALFGVAATSLVVWPLLLPLTLMWDGWSQNRWSSSRTLLFLTYFVCFEALGLVVLFLLWLRHLTGLKGEDFEEANRQMQRWWVRGFFGAALRIFSVRLEVHGRAHLDARRPSVILSRHASTLDTLLPLGLSQMPTRFRYVMKSELLLDPALDYCGQRLPNAFVRRGSADPQQEIAKVVDLGRALGPDDAVVLYPEGTRFSTAKRRRLLDKYQGDQAMHSIVEVLHHTLPPLREGSVQLVASTEGADVVFIAHRGLEGATAMSDLVTGGLTGAHLEVCIWRVAADDVPREPAAIKRFLVHHWRRIDAFAAGHRLPPLPS